MAGFNTTSTSNVAKWKLAHYLLDQPTSWFTIRNRSYSQWVGREPSDAPSFERRTEHLQMQLHQTLD
jgi:hypothetical protein